MFISIQVMQRESKQALPGHLSFDVGITSAKSKGYLGNLDTKAVFIPLH